MKNATVRPGVNEFEAMLVGKHMEERHPNVHYTMAPGNDCVWVYFGNQNWYFIFRDGKIADIQID